MLAWLTAFLRHTQFKRWLTILSVALCSACGGGVANGPPLAPLVGAPTATAMPGPNTIGLSQSAASLLPGAQTSVTIQAPAGINVSASSTNASVATVTSGSNGTYIIHGIAPGTASITLTAPNYTTVTVQVTVFSPIVLNPTALLLTGSSSTASTTASESGYSGIYTILANTAPGVATIAQTLPGNFAVTAVSAGTTAITIGDTNGQQKILNVNVAISLALSPSSIALSGVGSSQTFTASESGYSGAYSIVSNSTPATAMVVQTSPGVFTVTAVGSGTTRIVISDSGGVQQAVNVGVTVTHISISGSRGR